MLLPVKRSFQITLAPLLSWTRAGTTYGLWYCWSVWEKHRMSQAVEVALLDEVQRSPTHRG